jgi:hypothetical protein
MDTVTASPIFTRLLPFDTSPPIIVIAENSEFLFETGSAQPRQLGLEISNGCDDPADDYSVSSARINVLAAR